MTKHNLKLRSNIKAGTTNTCDPFVEIGRCFVEKDCQGEFIDTINNCMTCNTVYGGQSLLNDNGDCCNCP